MGRRGKKRNGVDLDFFNVEAIARRIDQRLAQAVATRERMSRAELTDSPMDRFRTRLHDGVSQSVADEFLSSHVRADATDRLFNSKAQADLTLHIGGHELPAHSVILAIQSEYFEVALRQGLLEKETREFHFNEDSPHALWRVFEFAYTGEYSADIDALGGLDDDELVRAVKVYVLADYFKIRGLQDYTLQRQAERLQGQWTSVDLVDCIREVYGKTKGDEDKMRALISGVAYQHLAQLWNDDAFRQLIREGGDFVVDMIGRNASGVAAAACGIQTTQKF